VRVSVGLYGLGENAHGAGNGHKSKDAASTYPAWLTPPRPAARPVRRVAFDEEEQLAA
jgi:hypothetical protein